MAFDIDIKTDVNEKGDITINIYGAPNKEKGEKVLLDFLNSLGAYSKEKFEVLTKPQKIS